MKKIKVILIFLLFQILTSCDHAEKNYRIIETDEIENYSILQKI